MYIMLKPSSLTFYFLFLLCFILIKFGNNNTLAQTFGISPYRSAADYQGDGKVTIGAKKSST